MGEKATVLAAEAAEAARVAWIKARDARVEAEVAEEEAFDAWSDARSAALEAEENSKAQINVIWKKS